VILDAAGNLYGTTYGGGTWNAGVVYKVDPAGQETVLYSFTGGADGGLPQSGVIRDSAGNLYGTASYGGTCFYGCGVVYKLDTKGNETVLYSFTGGADGGNPSAGVIRDSAGSLYGTTRGGGTANAGVVYKLDTKENETVLYTFTGGADGGNPQLGSLIHDPAGDLYGTTGGGGAAGSGVVYKVDPSGHETVLYSFTGGADGVDPLGVIRDPAGNLYGATFAGGTLATNVGDTTGFGVVFKLNQAGRETVLHNFTSGAGGADPFGVLIRDSAGNFYGTTFYGGTSGVGVVYKLDASGHETGLYSFTGGADGGSPFAGVIRDSAGNLYGTTNGGGIGSTSALARIYPPLLSKTDPGILT